jgi:hypothetical protein
MIIKLHNQENDLIDDFDGIEGLVSICTGDIYEGEIPFGTYCALCQGENFDSVSMLITAFHKIANNDFLSPALTIGVKYSSEGKLEAVDPHFLPWGDAEDSIVFGVFVKPIEYENNTLALKAYNLANVIIETDESINNRSSL